MAVGENVTKALSFSEILEKHIAPHRFKAMHRAKSQLAAAKHDSFDRGTGAAEPGDRGKEREYKMFEIMFAKSF